MTLKESLDKLKAKIEEIVDQIDSLDTSDEFDEVSTYLEYIRSTHNHFEVVFQDLSKKMDSNLETLIATQTVQSTYIIELKDQITRLFEHKESVTYQKSPEDRLNQEIARVLFTTSEPMYDFCIKEAKDRLRQKIQTFIQRPNATEPKKEEPDADIEYPLGKNESEDRGDEC